MPTLVFGRYHRTREEIRIFLLVDLRGSTQITERLENLRYHGFLERFVSDVTTSAMRYGPNGVVCDHPRTLSRGDSGAETRDVDGSLVAWFTRKRAPIWRTNPPDVTRS